MKNGTLTEFGNFTLFSDAFSKHFFSRADSGILVHKLSMFTVIIHLKILLNRRKGRAINLSFKYIVGLSYALYHPLAKNRNHFGFNDEYDSKRGKKPTIKQIFSNKIVNRFIHNKSDFGSRLRRSQGCKANDNI